MRGLVLALVLPACGFSANPGQPGDRDGGPDDGSGMEQAPDDSGCTSYSSLFNSCTQTPSGLASLVIPGGEHEYDTGSNALRINGTVTNPPRLVIDGPAGRIAVVFVSSLQVNSDGALRVFGPNALVIASSGDVQLDGTINSIGPGAGSRTDAVCGASTGGRGQNSNTGSGGSGGGGFQGAGGAGGQGNLGGAVTT
ncbi:MAG: hypothetical protein M3680_36795, partial [Myxococcota bacterium]|nr:hypothetical protein [Myxococcota bacterium]